MRPRRPWPIWPLAIGFLLFAISGFTRFGMALADYQLLKSVGINPGPAYLVLTGAVYGVSALGTALALWFGLEKAGRLARGLAFFYTAWHWIDKMFITQNPGARTNWRFDLILSLLLLGLALGALALPRVREFLGELPDVQGDST